MGIYNFPLGNNKSLTLTYLPRCSLMQSGWNWHLHTTEWT